MRQEALFELPAAGDEGGKRKRVRLLIKRLDPSLEMPSLAHEGDAGVDLRSRIAFRLPPGERRAVPTGIAVAIPRGYAGFVQPRSGLARTNGIGVLNSPGLIDSGYRGEVVVVLFNADPTEPIDVQRGDRIAQLVILAVPEVDVRETTELPLSERGEGGFGSTGLA